MFVKKNNLCKFLIIFSFKIRNQLIYVELFKWFQLKICFMEGYRKTCSFQKLLWHGPGLKIPTPRWRANIWFCWLSTQSYCVLTKPTSMMVEPSLPTTGLQAQSTCYKVHIRIKNLLICMTHFSKRHMVPQTTTFK